MPTSSRREVSSHTIFVFCIYFRGITAAIQRDPVLIIRDFQHEILLIGRPYTLELHFSLLLITDWPPVAADKLSACDKLTSKGFRSGISPSLTFLRGKFTGLQFTVFRNLDLRIPDYGKSDCGIGLASAYRQPLLVNFCRASRAKNHSQGQDDRNKTVFHENTSPF